MIKTLKELILKNEEAIKYIFFGVLTTAVSFIVYYLLYNIADFSAAASNGISWFFAVVFAFITNKFYVFSSSSWDPCVFIPELGKFFGCRIFSGVAETAILYITVDCLSYNGNFWKIITAVLVVILNYFASKFFVFDKK